MIEITRPAYRAWFAFSTLAAAACAPAAAGPSTDALLVPGVSRVLAEHRARTLSGIEYHLTLDLTRGDTLPGTVVILVNRASRAGDLVLDYRGLDVADVLVNGYSLDDYVWANGHLTIPDDALLDGDNLIGVRFTSAIAAAGASVIRTEEPADGEGGGDVYLYSLLVPADANQLFPSFDQPDLKATFVLDARAPDGWQVVSNAPLQEVGVTGDGAQWLFAATEPISTYLFAFAAGPWAMAAEATPPDDEDPIGLYVRRSRMEEVDADTLISLNRRALGWLERYFEMGYPFAKYDMVLAPAFPFGGMEHPGAVFYNESRFIFTEPPTLTERLGRASTVYHEVAHQWFGDLVTMRWFDDLWLKEGFSTYMAAKMQEELNPGTGAWKTFYMRNKPLAYGVDATRGTTPVWQELDNLDLAKGNYGPIVYNKAPAILKQLNHLVGEDAFRAGLSSLLWERAFTNITWRDLLAALEEASGESLDDFGEHYILRAGMPVIETELLLEDGRIAELALAQRPARELAGDPGGWWPGRIEVLLGYDHREDVVLPVSFTGDTTLVEGAAGLPSPDFVFANHGDYGYGMFLLDERSAEALAARVGGLTDDLLRAMVWGALWDLTGEGRLPAARFVELALRELPGERDEQIAASLVGRMAHALRRRMPGDATAADALQSRFERMMTERLDDPELSYGQRKASLDALLEAARTPAAIGTLVELLSEERTFRGEPLQQPSRWAAVQTLVALGHPTADSIHAAERERDVSAEAARRDFVAGAARPDAASKAAYFERYMEGAELNEEWVTASLGAFNHPEHTALTLPYLRPALDRLEWIRDNRRIFFLPQWVNAFIGGHSSPEALEIVDAYLADNPELPSDLRRKVLQARDTLERVVAAAETAQPPTSS